MNARRDSSVKLLRGYLGRVNCTFSVVSCSSVVIN
jgi:hypothetical protein